MIDEAVRAAFEAQNEHLVCFVDDKGEYERATTKTAWTYWRRATLAERERAAKACEAEHVGDSVEDECDNKGDYAYNMALRHAAAAIRNGEPS